MIRLSFLSFLLFSFINCVAQDTYFSQFNSAPLQLNKGFAGSKGCSRIVMGAREQWLNLDGGYKTYYFSYDQYSRHLRSGFGIEHHYTDESNGTFGNSATYFSFSPSISVGRRVDSLRPFVIKPAFNYGVVQYWFNWRNVSFGDMIDPMYGYIYNTNETKNQGVITAPDFGIGLLTYTENFFAGIYFHHITEPDIAFLYPNSPLPARMVLNGGYCFKDEHRLGRFALIPSIIFESQSTMNRIELSLSSNYRNFMLGISERFASSTILKVGYESKFIKVGYAYDINTTSARKGLGATHEIILNINFAYRKKSKKIVTLDFPLL